MLSRAPFLYFSEGGYSLQCAAVHTYHCPLDQPCQFSSVVLTFQCVCVCVFSLANLQTDCFAVFVHHQLCLAPGLGDLPACIAWHGGGRSPDKFSVRKCGPRVVTLGDGAPSLLFRSIPHASALPAAHAPHIHVERWEHLIRSQT